ncbi:MAG: hypothetical protein M3Y58_12300 [Chloroflexota bacterium]|nr:hypothetical protein [Chloroflexota bacterium]
MTPEEIAQQFHEAYERLAPDYGYKTREASAKPWAEVPEQNKRLMIAVAAEVGESIIAVIRSENVRAYNTLEERNADLEAENAGLKRMKDELNPVGTAMAAWLHSRIALTEASSSVNFEAAEAADDALERALRGYLIRPGMRGSWGRGAPRSWECDFDPQGKDGVYGCECAGGGLSEEQCRTCFYRTPIGKKGT